ncbi:MAG: GGDEF domain-containing protein [Desulfobacterales bacterium]|nr:GGDEF domain-containing protein [Desulfobacterales bacterium]
MASLVSACAWIVADLLDGHPYSNILIPVWNTLIRFSFFVIITLLLSSFKISMEREKELSRIDYLTGAVNTRLFYELAQAEIDRFHRYEHPFTLAYIDLDNFKSVNDQFGHSTGDQVLRTVVNSARKYLRKTDVLARLGGDEFALLLSETDQESARVAISNIQSKLSEEMRQNNWPVTFSIGVLTCNRARCTPLTN